MVENAVINRYLNDFRIALSRYLKPGVGIQTISYPFKNGAVLVVEFGFGILTKSENRASSNDLSEALLKTNLFERFPAFTPTIPGTTLILSQNRVIILKTDEEKNWSKFAVENDIRNIVRAIKKKHKTDGRKN